jgi:L-iditol 2-dehydrogenase
MLKNGLEEIMKAWRLHSVNKFTCDNIEKPVPKGEEILIEIGACGVCGSDIPRVFSLGTRVYPVTIGHEFSGTVVEVGENANKELIGKRAAVFPLIPCRECENCMTGNYAQCTNYNYLGSRNDGGFAEYCLVPSEWHLIISENEDASLIDLAMLEPAVVALHSLMVGGINPLDNLVIFGAGPIGIIIAKWAEYYHYRNVMLIDIDDQKVEFAQKNGFEKVINAKKIDPVEWIKSVTEGNGADLTIEGTGTGVALQQAIYASRYFSRIVMLGNPHKNTTIPLTAHSEILRKQLTLKGSWNSYYSESPHNEWRYAAKILENGGISVSELVTHKVGIEDVHNLFVEIRNNEEFFCKSMFVNQ